MSEIPGQSGYALPNLQIWFAPSSSHPTRLATADSVQRGWVCALDASGPPYRKTLFEGSKGNAQSGYEKAHYLQEVSVDGRLSACPIQPGGRSAALNVMGSLRQLRLRSRTIAWRLTRSPQNLFQRDFPAQDAGGQIADRHRPRDDADGSRRGAQGHPVLAHLAPDPRPPPPLYPVRPPHPTSPTHAHPHE